MKTMSETVSALEGSTFVVSDRRGDIEASPTDTTGLFHRDTRFLSRWVLTVNGTRPNILSVNDLDYFRTQFFLVPGTGTIYVDADMSIERTRSVGAGFHEEITVANHSDKAMDLEIRLEAASDFADLFEVKDALAKKGEFYNNVEDSRLVLGYRRQKFKRETRISASQPVKADATGLRFKVRLQAHGEWTTGVDVVASDGVTDKGLNPKYGSSEEAARPNMGTDMNTWLASVPQLTSSWRPLERTYQRSLVDLAALRFYPLLAPKESLPAAGLPWFMALFGRDSIITSLRHCPSYRNWHERPCASWDYDRDHGSITSVTKSLGRFFTRVVRVK